MKLAYVTGFIACAVLLSGCYQIKEKTTLNPDQSGKVSIDIVFPPTSIDLTGGNKKKPDEMLRDSVRDLLKNSSGSKHGAMSHTILRMTGKYTLQASRISGTSILSN